MRGLLAAGAACVLLAIAACGGSGSSGPPPGSVDVKLSEFKFQPDSITHKAGSVTFFLENNGTTSHDMVIFDSSGKQVAASELIQPGNDTTLQVTLQKGDYTFKCTQPGHADAGMRGTLKITG